MVIATISVAYNGYRNDFSMEYKKVQGDLVLSPSDLNRSPVKLVHELPVRGKLPTIDESPESETHGLSHDSHQSEEYFHGPSGMDPEIYDCPRFLPRPRPIRRPMMMNLIYPQHHHHDDDDEDDDEEGGGSCSSSQASAKSDKNMADFDGEDDEEDESSSVCEDALAQLSAQLSQFDQHQDHGHHRHHHHHHHHHPHRLQAHVKGRQRPIANVSPVQRNRLSSSCSTHGEDDDEDGQIIPFEDFSFEDVCKQSHTLLWDLVQDESAVHLGDGLSSEAEKLLCSLVCVFPEREIRMRFVEGCLENLKQHRSVVVSLRLIPKLFASFQQYRNNYNTHWITMWAERELGMMNLFFADLLHYTGQVRLAKKPEKQLPDVLNGFKTLPAIKPNTSKAKAEVSKTKDDGQNSSGTPSGGDLAPVKVDWGKLLTENKPHKLLYSLQIIEALGQPTKKQRSKSVASLGSSEHSASMAEVAAMKVKKSKSETNVYDMDSDVDVLSQRSWSTMFISCGGLKHLFGIFMSACLETREDKQWNFK
eukprot:XP_011665521.1 PREDICTED: ubiquitin carboxyl-terminal hydrolase 34-like [Strongylocentrotus purpuratus]